MKLMKLLPVTAMSIILLGGCTAATGGRSSSVQQDVDSLRAEVAALRDSSRLSDLRGSGAGAEESNRLRSDIQRLSDNLELLNGRLERLEQRSGGPSSESEGSAGYPAAAESGSGGGLVKAAQTPAVVAPASTSPAPLPPTANSGPYEEGKSLFDKKSYREAITSFTDYLAANPKGSNAAAAQFYIGESLYAQQKYEEAILEYQKVIQGFPKSSQVPTSILKQGLSFQAIEENDSAKLLYQKVIQNYPKSYAAGVAQERMKNI